eukprot:m.450443 g.450443  ORF g.450443 m.450443 type:complete len:442 (+) comp20002_c0_seq1:65-1390(+)
MGGMGSKSKPLPTDARPPADGEAVAVPTGWCELDLTGTPACGSRKADGPLGDESIATVGDFVWAEGAPNDSVAELCDLLKSTPQGITPYCVDHIRRRVILVRAPADELTKGTFVYQQQRQHATQVYGVPYGMLAEAVEQLTNDDAGWMDNLVFLHSTGRCGSTLLCRLLGKAQNVVSLSEPDIYSYITWVRSYQPDGLDSVLGPKVLRAISWMLYKFGSPKGDAVVCIKLRSQVVELAETLKKAMPSSKTLFLYRDPVDTIDSFCMAFFSGFVQRQLRWWNIDSWFIYKISGWDKNFPYLAPLLATDNRFPADLYRQLGFVGLITMIWLSNMDTADRLQRTSFFDACVRYEDLCTHRVKVAAAIMDKCGYSSGGFTDTDANAVFDEDAHSTTSETRSRRREAGSKGPMYITEQDDPILRELIKCHEGLHSRNFTLPNTLTF